MTYRITIDKDGKLPYAEKHILTALSHTDDIGSLYNRLLAGFPIEEFSIKIEASETSYSEVKCSP